jgi:iron complex outermembrane receptor protein
MASSSDRAMFRVTVNTNGQIGFPGFSPFGFNGRYVYARLSYNW